MKDPEVHKLRIKAMTGVAEKYARHKSFYGASRSRLWADVEVFRFAGKVYSSALLLAPPRRMPIFCRYFLDSSP